MSILTLTPKNKKNNIYLIHLCIIKKCLVYLLVLGCAKRVTGAIWLAVSVGCNFFSGQKFTKYSQRNYIYLSTYFVCWIWVFTGVFPAIHISDTANLCVNTAFLFNLNSTASVIHIDSCMHIWIGSAIVEFDKWNVCPVCLYILGASHRCELRRTSISIWPTN